MLMFGSLHHLLLAGTCLCVCGTPVDLLNFSPVPDSDCEGQCARLVTTFGPEHTTDVQPEPSDTEHVTGLMLDVGEGGGAGPHGRPMGIDGVTPTENGDGLDGRSGPSEADGEAKKVRSTSEMEDVGRQSEADPALPVDSKGEKEGEPAAGEPILSPTGGRKQLDTLNPGGLIAVSTEPPQLSLTDGTGEGRGGEDRTKLPGDSPQGKDPDTGLPCSTDPPIPGAQIQTLTSHSPAPPSVFVSPRTSTPLSVWGLDGAPLSSVPDSLLPEIGPNLMPKEDGPESLWTEAARPGGGESEN